jgi:H+-transporting ATPase
MDALVVTTGMHTYFGKTAKLVEQAQPKSHFQRAVVKIGDYLIVLAVVLVTVVFMVALFRQESIIDTLEFALILIVAAIPAALPAVLSVTLAVGAIALAKKEAIVSKLAAIEEMSGVDVLCADKTGTITKNELTVADINPDSGFKSDDVLFLGALASREEDKDPIDNAVIIRAKAEPTVLEQLGTYKVLSFKPFDPVIKRTEAKIQDSKGTIFQVSKGAPQVILQLVKADKTLTSQVDKVIADFASKGHRALGVAKTNEKAVW